MYMLYFKVYACNEPCNGNCEHWFVDNPGNVCESDEHNQFVQKVTHSKQAGELERSYTVKLGYDRVEVQLHITRGTSVSRAEALGTSETQIMKSTPLLVVTYDHQLPHFGKSHRGRVHNGVTGILLSWHEFVMNSIKTWVGQPQWSASEVVHVYQSCDSNARRVLHLTYSKELQ